MIEQIETIIPESKKTAKILYCDICGIKLDDQCNLNGSGNNDDAILYYGEGNSWPGNNCTEYTQLDICMRCMRDKVVPVIEKEFKITSRKSDWCRYF